MDRRAQPKLPSRKGEVGGGLRAQERSECATRKRPGHRAPAFPTHPWPLPEREGKEVALDLHPRRHADVAARERGIVLEHARMAARLDVEDVVRREREA